MGRPKGYQKEKAITSHAVESENKEQGDQPQLYISSPQNVEGIASFHLPSRGYNDGIPLSVHNPPGGEGSSNISWMDSAVREMNDNNARGSWHSDNQFIQASNASVSGHSPAIGELAMSNFVSTAGLPNAAWSRATRMPLPSPMLGFAQPASYRPQNPPVTAVRNFSPGSVRAPPISEVSVSMARHNESGPVTVPSCRWVPKIVLSHGQPGPVVVPSNGPLRSMPLQSQPGQPVPVNAVSGVKASQGGQFPKNVRVQQASKGIPHQSQASVTVNPLRSTRASARTLGQEIRQVNVPQSSTTHSGPSLKRGSSKLLPVAPIAQRRKTRSTIPARPSVPTSRPVAPPLPSSSVNSSKPHIRSSLLQNPVIQSLLEMQSTDYIKWDEEEKIGPSGYQCPICKRDLSYAPEGPINQPENVQSTSVLPCGHYFHSSCLLRITPADKAENPPCIPCALDG